MLYVGETLRSLEERVREHIRNINGEDLRYPVARHFCQAGHSLNDFRVQGLWLVKGDCAERKILEHWLMHKIGTITPDGMNVEKHVAFSCLLLLFLRENLKGRSAFKC